MMSSETNSGPSQQVCTLSSHHPGHVCPICPHLLPPPPKAPGSLSVTSCATPPAQGTQPSSPESQVTSPAVFALLEWEELRYSITPTRETSTSMSWHRALSPPAPAAFLSATHNYGVLYYLNQRAGSFGPESTDWMLGLLLTTGTDYLEQNQLNDYGTILSYFLCYQFCWY